VDAGSSNNEVSGGDDVSSKASGEVGGEASGEASGEEATVGIGAHAALGAHRPRMQKLAMPLCSRA
jgi:hypothetical protein